MAQRQWWERPRLQGDEEEQHERRVDWLELFFDLVFVVVIAELSHYLATHVSLVGLAGYALLFIPAWWTWIGFVFYTERFETYDISFRLFAFGLMIPVAAMASFVYYALGKYATGFALSYAVARAIVTYMYLRAGWYVPAFRPISIRYGIGFSLSILLFVVSVFLPSPTRFLLWAAGLTIDLVTPMVTPHLQRRLPLFTGSRLPERFGLFVIIVLGEAIASVIRGAAGASSLSITTGVTALLGLLLAFGLWWVYFDYVGRWRPRAGAWWNFAWNYLHLPLVMAIAAVSAGVLDFIAPSDKVNIVSVSWLIAGATAVGFTAIGLIELTLQPDARLLVDRRLTAGLKLATAVGALIVGAVVVGHASELLFGLDVLLAVHVVYAAYVWYRRSAHLPITQDEPA